MRLVSGVRAHARPRLAAVLRKEDTGRARAARGEEERSLPQFITVATTDELADDQAKLVEVEDQKGCPVWTEASDAPALGER
jgi:hypothetical protein